MSGEGSGRSRGSARSGAGSRAKSGKPRPGTGGYGRRKLEGKGPTPAAELRPGHPAQRRGAAAAAGSARGRSGARNDGPGARQGGPGARDGGSGARQGGPGARDGGPGGAAAERAPRGASRFAARGARSGGAGAAGTAEIVAGRNAVLESLRAAVPAVALHVGPRLDPDERINEAVKLAADRGVNVVEAGRAELDRLTGGAVHQGLALRIRPYEYAHPDDLIATATGGASASGQPPLVVALDGITDPRNLGAVVRCVAAFGGDGVLIPVRRSAGVTAGAWKASAGALARVRVAQASNLVRTLVSYAEAGMFIVGLDAEARDDIATLPLADGPLVLVIGSEGKGLSRLVTQQCDAVVKIPISGAESLNAGVAAGIALYQVSRLRAGRD
ncbi:MAG TPA: 23S rRNA (guanosine(2251)-2'-O)-methyltransferase RlmB [Streptosporangiaceae bacterium]|nr:23S rRNA (guanosine(2251)-2'-O)-methyltransferase RlmB [Streptosporangiaceae bacterium]